jgi:hypothetical protein
VDTNLVMRYLVSNAIDFMRTAVEEFERRPKYSLINAYTAVELFLKARLLEHDWRNVVIDEPTEEAFLAGEARTIGLDDARKRLKAVSDPLPRRAYKAFNSLRRHRNKFVHFYHPEAAANELFHFGDDAPVPAADLARSILVSWFFLHQLIRGSWQVTFRSWDIDLGRLHETVTAFSEYLGVAYDLAKPRLEELRQEGVVLLACPVCHRDSQQRQDITAELHDDECVVCHFQARVLDWECESCGETVELIGSGFGRCEHCDETVEPPDITARLAKLALFHKDYLEAGYPAACSQCGETDCVAPLSGELVCSSCLHIHDPGDLRTCGQCGQVTAGPLPEDAFWTGCLSCEGVMDRLHRDD